MGELNNTVIAGVVILVVGQLATRFVLDPLQEWRTLRGEIAHALYFYANVVVGPGFHTPEFGHEAAKRYRDLGGQVWQKAYAIPFYRLFAFCRIVPSPSGLREVVSGLTGLSNSVFSGHEGSEANRARIRTALRLKH